MKVAVIGAGTMGSGIAQAFAQSDAVEKVYLCDIKQEFADGGKAKIKKALDKRVAKGKMEQAAEDALLGKIVTGLHLRFQHLFPVHHRDRRRPFQARRWYALLQSGSCYEADRGHQGRQHSGRRCGKG